MEVAVACSRGQGSHERTRRMGEFRDQAAEAGRAAAGCSQICEVVHQTIGRPSASAIAVSVGFFSGPVVKQLLSTTTTFGTSWMRFHDRGRRTPGVVHAHRAAEVVRRARVQVVERARGCRRPDQQLQTPRQPLTGALEQVGDRLVVVAQRDDRQPRRRRPVERLAEVDADVGLAAPSSRRPAPRTAASCRRRYDLTRSSRRALAEGQRAWTSSGGPSS